MDPPVHHNDLVVRHLLQHGQMFGVHYAGGVEDLHHHVGACQPGPEDGGEES